MGLGLGLANPNPNPKPDPNPNPNPNPILQAEPVAALAVASRRGFAADAAASAAAATEAARRCAATPPVVTLYVPSLAAAGLSMSTSTTTVMSTSTSTTDAAAAAAVAPFAAPRAADILLRSVPLVLPRPNALLRPNQKLPPVALPPPNSWVPSYGGADTGLGPFLRRQIVRRRIEYSPAFAAAANRVFAADMMPASRVGACAASRQGGELPGCLRESTADGIGVLQLPGCIAELGSMPRTRPI